MSVRPSPKLRPNLWDALAVLAVLALAVGFSLRTWGSGEGGRLTAVISADGETVERVELRRLTSPEERTLTANGYTLHLLLAPDGRRRKSLEAPLPGRQALPPSPPAYPHAASFLRWRC